MFGNRYVGGIVSVNGLNSTIENMTNKGLVAGLGANAAYVGGIAGVSQLQLLQPFFGLVLAAVFLSEPIAWTMIAATAAKTGRRTEMSDSIMRQAAPRAPRARRPSGTPGCGPAGPAGSC